VSFRILFYSTPRLLSRTCASMSRLLAHNNGFYFAAGFSGDLEKVFAELTGSFYCVRSPTIPLGYRPYRRSFLCSDGRRIIEPDKVTWTRSLIDLSKNIRWHYFYFIYLAHGIANLGCLQYFSAGIMTLLYGYFLLNMWFRETQSCNAVPVGGCSSPISPRTDTYHPLFSGVSSPNPFLG